MQRLDGHQEAVVQHVEPLQELAVDLHLPDKPGALLVWGQRGQPGSGLACGLRFLFFHGGMQSLSREAQLTSPSHGEARV